LLYGSERTRGTDRLACRDAALRRERTVTLFHWQYEIERETFSQLAVGPDLSLMGPSSMLKERRHFSEMIAIEAMTRATVVELPSSPKKEK